MSSTQSIIQFGLKLLKKGRLEANEMEAYKDAFSTLGVDVAASLKLAALKSVFSDPDDKTDNYFLPFPLNPEHINYPCDSAPPGDVPGFGEAELAGSNELTLLEKYGTFVSVVAITDDVDSAVHTQTPVYDLFKTAAAIDDCLKTGEGKEKFLMVGCDFSGIQDTVYTITSKGALKTLRARSFMLELLTEHIIHEIITAVGASRHAIIYSGGGGFGLLLPNRSIAKHNKEISIKKIIEEYSDVLNKWSLKEFSGRFFIAIDAHFFSSDALTSKEKFQSLRQTQSDNLDRHKRCKFVKQFDDLFKSKMPEQLTVQTECQITRRDDLDNDQMRDIGVNDGEVMSEKNKNEDGRVWVSESCFHQFKIGDRLIDANTVNRYTVFVDRTEKKNYGTLVLPGTDGNDVFYKVDEEPDKGAECYWQINDWQDNPVFLYANYVRKHGELSHYAQKKESESLNEDGQHTPDSEHTATFQGLASSSCGADLIGALRMDVDNMGLMFSEIKTHTELSAKSRMLNLFFKVYLNLICCERKTDIIGKNASLKEEYGKSGRNVSVIYSGGDDLFIVGAWDETVELAFDIQKSFEGFINGRGIGISGGLTLHQPKFPLYQMARRSEDAEKFAKHDKDKEHKPAEKNRIALFYDEEKMRQLNRIPMSTPNRYMLSMTWGLGANYLLELMKVYSLCGKQIGKDQDRKVFELNRNTISYQTIEKWFQVLVIYRLKARLYLPIMARVLKDLEDAFGVDEGGIFKKLFQYLYTKPYTEELYLANLHIALNWLSYLGRNN